MVDLRADFIMVPISQETILYSFVETGKSRDNRLEEYYVLYLKPNHEREWNRRHKKAKIRLVLYRALQNFTQELYNIIPLSV